ncbi:MAG: Na+/H+ antiporter NhaA [Flavobacteriales bacterium]|nr:Na+/H+ antiporter NhaA [Flavobacteriales bacterium]
MNYKKVKEIAMSSTFGGALLFLSAVAAFIWANVSPESYHYVWGHPHTINLAPHIETILENGVEVEKVSYFMTFTIKSLELLVNDFLMAIFFFSIGLEIKREILVGKLSSFKKAILPVGAAVGGMLVPALVYVAITVISGEHDLASRGWGIPTATDIAFSLAVMSLLVKQVPIALKVFLMALAVADDIGAMLVIAIFYTDHLNFQALAFGLVGVIILFIANMMHNRTKFFYYAVGVLVVWTQFLTSGVHATIAGLLTGLAFPSAVAIMPGEYTVKAQKLLDKIKGMDEDKEVEKGVPSEKLAERYAELRHLTARANSPMMTVEHGLAPYVSLFIMPVFALANAGVTLGEGGIAEALVAPVAMGVGLGLFLGKPVGIFLMTLIFVKLKIGKLPEGVNWKQIWGMGMIAGMGFTMSIFVTSLAFRTSDPSLVEKAGLMADESKVAILIASSMAAICGYMFLRLVSKKKH